MAEAERLAETVRSAAANAPDGRPPWDLAFASRRAALIAQQVEAELRAALARLEGGIAAQQRAAVEAALSHTQRLAELGQEAAAGQAQYDLRQLRGTDGPTWNRLPVEAVQHLAGAAGAGTPLGALLTSLSADSGRRLRERLIAGMAAGKHPTVIAKGLREEAALTAARAETIARTEVIRAYRAASQASYQANPTVVRGYRRLAAKDRRSCALCLALDGEQYASEEIMPSHPRCRCAMVPVTAGNRDLGIDRDAPRRVRQSGADWFDGQDAAVQRALLGPGGYDLYRRGARLRDFVGVHDSPDWGPTLRRKPLGEVAAGLRAGAADTWKAPHREAVEQALRQAADEIRHRPVEDSVTLDRDGRVLERTRGMSARHAFTDARKARGSIVIHNHPHGGAFSGVDVQNLAQNGLFELRVVTRFGDYHLRLPPGTKIMAEDAKYFERQGLIWGERYLDAAAERGMTVDEAVEEALHSMWEHEANRRGWLYGQRRVAHDND